MQGVTVVDHPLVQHKLTLIRDKDRSTKSFRELLKRDRHAARATRSRATCRSTEVEIETPMTRMTKRRSSPARSSCSRRSCAPASRFVDGMLDLVPAARVAHIGLYRDPETLTAVEYFFKTPADLAERLVIVVSPVIATANTAVAAIDRLKERGAKDIRVVCLIAAPRGLRAGARHSSRRADLDRRDRRAARRATPISSRASATPATAPTAPVDGGCEWLSPLSNLVLD